MSILEKLKAYRAKQKLQLISNPLYTKEYRFKYITSNNTLAKKHEKKEKRRME